MNISVLKAPLHLKKKKEEKNRFSTVKDSNISTAEKIHADVARVALQRVHINRIELPVLSSSDEVSIAWKVDNTIYCDECKYQC